MQEHRTIEQSSHSSSLRPHLKEIRASPVLKHHLCRQTPPYSQTGPSSVYLSLTLSAFLVFFYQSHLL